MHGIVEKYSPFPSRHVDACPSPSRRLDMDNGHWTSAPILPAAGNRAPSPHCVDACPPFPSMDSGHVPPPLAWTCVPLSSQQ